MAADEAQCEFVHRFFRAMQAGEAGHEELMSLFADDAVMVDPFTGKPETRNGIGEIRESFRCTLEQPTPDIKLEVNRIDLDGPLVRAEWTCTAPSFPSPVKGYDLFDLREGKIARLEIVVTEAPGMDGG